MLLGQDFKLICKRRSKVILIFISSVYMVVYSSVLFLYLSSSLTQYYIYLNIFFKDLIIFFF